MKNKRKELLINVKIYEDLRFSRFTPLESYLRIKGISLTGFRRAVWKAACEIPLGQTRTYQWVARRIGRHKATRAVGQALKKNPFPIFIPCHRVVRANGQLGGYLGGDKKKQRLLSIEKEIAKAIEIDRSSFNKR